MDNQSYKSRLPGFFALPPEQRRQLLYVHGGLTELDFKALDDGLSLSEADYLSENVLGTFSLPFSVAANFVVDDESVLVPMVTEEPSIVAAASKMAKIVAQAGGFRTTSTLPLMRGQIQLFNLLDVDKAHSLFLQQKQELIAYLNQLCPNMVQRGGGVVGIECRTLASPKVGPILLIESRINVVDAMGANIVNHLMEALGEKLSFLGGTVCLRILSNLCDERLARASCSIPVQLFAADQTHDFGERIAVHMEAAHALAEIDIYRACTHNKGIMNGIDAVSLATGNDFRALEAAAHAYAARDGHYKALTEMYYDRQSRMLNASLVLPLSVGVVGGNCGSHRGVKVAQKILGSFARSGPKLASVMVSVGLAQCLAALLALSSEGIQKGHMRLHNKKLIK